MTAASSHMNNRRTGARQAHGRRPGLRRSSRWPGSLAFVAQAALPRRRPADQGRGAAAARRAGRGPPRARRPGAAAGRLHHRQPGPAFGRPAGHDARARRRAASTCNAGGVDSIVAAEASGRTRARVQPRPHGALPDPRRRQHRLRDARAAAGGRAALRRRPRGHFGRRPRSAQRLRRSTRSTSAAARTAPAASCVHTNDPRASRPASARKAAASSSTSRAPRSADDLARRYDVVDFATPVSSFDVSRVPSGTRIVVARGRRLRAARLPDATATTSLEVRPSRKAGRRRPEQEASTRASA